MLYLSGGGTVRIAVGCDHRGVELKQAVIRILTETGHEYQDFGCPGTGPVDYPDIAVEVAGAVARGEFERGILICGTGIGMCIAANKVKGIRAAQCPTAFMAHRARQHNDAQICCLAAEGDMARVASILEAFLTTEFEGGRHQARLDKISKIEGGGV
jgi:ribose 5-phosphate isomerase B